MEFRMLQFQHPSQDILLVTGIVEGRKATECEYISTGFSHSWSFKNGKPVSENEQ